MGEALKHPAELAATQTRAYRRAAVLGAGVMGAQIAAHLANAGLEVLLFDLAGEGEDPSAPARAGLSRLKGLKPVPHASPRHLAAVSPCNYERDLDRLRDCDLVIEAVTERLELKRELYARVSPHMAEDALLATNTSGLSVTELAQGLSELRRPHFCGVHFFNPPRYMHLVELVPHPGTRPEVLDSLEGFLTTVMGKCVIRAKDTPNFIANRVGVFSMLVIMHHAAELGLGLDTVDALTGTSIGRPKSATFRTADVVGLDVLAHVVGTLAQSVPDDPWHAVYRLPDWLNAVLERGDLGQKSGAGVYRKRDREILVLDTQTLDYRPRAADLDPAVKELFRSTAPQDRFQALRASPHPQAQLLYRYFRDLFHYSAVHLESIAETARDVDLAMRWGFGWDQGPFEAWQASGWRAVADTIAEEVAEGRTLASVSLPGWVTTPGREGVHGPDGSWSPRAGRPLAPPSHPVYLRQALPVRLLGEDQPRLDTVFETEAVLLRQLRGVALLEFKTKMHTVTDAVLDGLMEALDAAEREFKGLVLWQPEPPFCAGANLAQVLQAVERGELDSVAHIVARFQRASLALRYRPVPTVAAVSGLALGGGCELMLHCDRVVAGLESYVGLVETGVGLIPGAGGCKEMTLRAADRAQKTELMAHLAPLFEQIALAKVAGSAHEAREMAYLRRFDPVLLHPRELLHTAVAQAEALFESGYRPPLPERAIRVAGATGIASLQAQLVNLREGGFISEHDLRVAHALATVLCGGEVDPDTRVGEEWLLDLERDHFMRLLTTEESRARIVHMLKTGKPLRN